MLDKLLLGAGWLVVGGFMFFGMQTSPEARRRAGKLVLLALLVVVLGWRIAVW
ncbi:MAG TPA: hypothetical protein VI643_05960 [Planctomycetota bacterium]|nr:hypothetical protein [Planctomycetota bacterium]